ncbi:MAG: AAA family ATPase [Betaproteobacteria bacterium]|nr:AAA family ATPase [Betaproteobacteria bacterium]
MRIRELRLIRYGKFTDRVLSLPGRERDIHLVVGPNEAGKSTVRAAIGDWLFGIPTRTPLAFLHPMPELRIGGVIERPASGATQAERLSFDRTKGNRNTLRTPADGPLPDDTLAAWLGGLQAQAFNRLYALDHASLVEGGAGILSASDDLGQMLFQSAAGIDHLGAILQTLRAEAESVWAPRKSGARAYYQAQEAYEAAQTEFRRATLRTRDWKTRHEALADTQAELDAARVRDADLRRQISRLERIRRVRPLLLQLDRASEQRDALLADGEIAILDENAGDLFREALQALAVARADIARLSGEIAEAQAFLARTPVDHTVLSLAPDIIELNERRLQFRAHRTDILKREEEIRLLWVGVQDQVRGLGWPADTEEAVRQRLPAAPARSRLGVLIRERGALAQALAAGRADLAERERQQQAAEEALSRLSAEAVDPALREALERGLRLGDHEATLAEHQRSLDELGMKIDRALGGLGDWRRPVSSLQAMVLPDLPALQGLIDRHKADGLARDALREGLEEKTQALARLERDLQQFMRHFQPVTRDEVLQARQIRDAAWQAIRRDPPTLIEQGEAFEARLVDADRLADQRHDRAQHEADRQSRADALDRLRQERLDLERRAQSLAREMAQRVARWDDMARAAGLPDLPLELAASWLQQRQQVLSLDAERALAERALRVRQAEADRVRDQLWRLLRRDLPGSDDAPAPELPACLRQARDRVTQADEAHGQRLGLAQQIRDGRLALANARAVTEAAQQAWDAWTRSWQAAAGSVGYPPEAAPDQVEAELAVMQAVEQGLDRIRHIRSERIEAMQADLDGLAQGARSLAARAALDLSDPSAEAVILELVRRLDLAKKAGSERADGQARLERDRDALAAAEQRLQAVMARLRPIMLAAGVASETELGPAIERSDRLRAIDQAIRSVEQDLVASADGLALPALRAEVEEIGPDALSADLARLGAEAAEGVNRIAALSNAYGAGRTAFDAMDGTDAAARAEAQRQEAIAAMAEAAERYLRLQTAVRLLHWSLERFRETRQGPMLQRASAIFSGLTLGSFSRLLVDTDSATPRLLGLRPEGRPVEVSGMSEGSRDQLYLALRLAALGLQSSTGADMPLIADDLFINFDDRRTAAGLHALGELSRGMQVVFLTHHDHLVPLAREVLGHDLNVIVL